MAYFFSKCLGAHNDSRQFVKSRNKATVACPPQCNKRMTVCYTLCNMCPAVCYTLVDMRPELCSDCK